ncbi:14051_t:CDS:2 [Funneliformis mosseae]|uniref:14051_t:CDS:1 n=1 Tax=Funneliformis mosseae TaxID=27381 RepID=A0A9N9GSX3_FUNMO|nr:14051_t:CDS:2 [Funneliformis mosseae]
MSTAPVIKLDVTDDKFLGHSVLRTYVTNISYLQFLNKNKEKKNISSISIKNTLDGDSLRLIEKKSDYPQTPGHQIFPPEHNRSEYYEDGVQTPEDFSVDDINVH